MRTPAGKQCSFFYGDYYRGRNFEECRLLKDNGLGWSPRLCGECPVPEIQTANSCRHQVLTPELKRPIFFLRSQVSVTAYCNKNSRQVTDPRIGCGQCHPELPEFILTPDDTDDTI